MIFVPTTTTTDIQTDYFTPAARAHGVIKLGLIYCIFKPCSSSKIWLWQQECPAFKGLNQGVCTIIIDVRTCTHIYFNIYMQCTYVHVHTYVYSTCTCTPFLEALSTAPLQYSAVKYDRVLPRSV